MSNYEPCVCTRLAWTRHYSKLWWAYLFDSVQEISMGLKKILWRTHLIAHIKTLTLAQKIFEGEKCMIEINNLITLETITWLDWGIRLLWADMGKTERTEKIIWNSAHNCSDIEFLPAVSHLRLWANENNALVLYNIREESICRDSSIIYSFDCVGYREATTLNELRKWECLLA